MGDLQWCIPQKRAPPRRYPSSVALGPTAKLPGSDLRKIAAALALVKHCAFFPYGLATKRVEHRTVSSYALGTSANGRLSVCIP
jgi:hypothetical protein